jgi:hypothetical protein
MGTAARAAESCIDCFPSHDAPVLYAYTDGYQAQHGTEPMILFTGPLFPARERTGDAHRYFWRQAWTELEPDAYIYLVLTQNFRYGGRQTSPYS